MRTVDAVNEWIDAHIDDYGDEELEDILEAIDVLDSCAESTIELTDLTPEHLANIVDACETADQAEVLRSAVVATRARHDLDDLSTTALDDSEPESELMVVDRELANDSTDNDLIEHRDDLGTDGSESSGTSPDAGVEYADADRDNDLALEDLDEIVLIEGDRGQASVASDEEHDGPANDRHADDNADDGDGDGDGEPVFGHQSDDDSGAHADDHTDDDDGDGNGDDDTDDDSGAHADDHTDDDTDSSEEISGDGSESDQLDEPDLELSIESADSEVTIGSDAPADHDHLPTEGTAQLPVYESIQSIRLDEVVADPGDNLGPGFLGTVDVTVHLNSDPEPEPKPGIGARHFAIATLFSVMLGMFLFGAIQLIGSLSTDDALNEAPTATATATADPTRFPSEQVDDDDETTDTGDVNVSSSDTRDPGSDSPSSNDIAATPSVAMLLADGSVAISRLGPDKRESAEIIFDSAVRSANIAQLSRLESDLVAVTKGGNIIRIDVPTGDTSGLWRQNNLVRARAAFEVSGRLAVLDENGRLSLSPTNEQATDETIEVVWEPDERGEIQVAEITSAANLVPFVTDQGDALMMISSQSRTDLVEVWNAAEAGSVSSPMAGETAVLLRTEAGAVAKFLFADLDEPVLSTEWDPAEQEGVEAMGFAPTARGNVILLDDGDVVFTNGAAPFEVLWDAQENDLAVQAVAADSTNILLLLDSGTVVRVPADGTGSTYSAWDVSGGAASPAVQVVLLPPLAG